MSALKYPFSSSSQNIPGAQSQQQQFGEQQVPPSNSTLFIGDLSAFCSERDVHDLFSPFGEIAEIKIMRSEETQRNLSYGFLRYSSPLNAANALAALNGVLFCGRHLRVGWAAYRNKKEPKLKHQDKLDSASIHFSYISFQLERLITEESIRQLFSKFGAVLDTSIKKSYVDESTHRQCGYGFVHYSSSAAGVQSALRAVQQVNDATVDDVDYKCSISHTLERQLAHSHQPINIPPSFLPSNNNSVMNSGPTARSFRVDRSAGILPSHSFNANVGAPPPMATTPIQSSVQFSQSMRSFERVTPDWFAHEKQFAGQNHHHQQLSNSNFSNGPSQRFPIVSPFDMFERENERNRSAGGNIRSFDTFSIGDRFSNHAVPPQRSISANSLNNYHKVESSIFGQTNPASFAPVSREHRSMVHLSSNFGDIAPSIHSDSSGSALDSSVISSFPLSIFNSILPNSNSTNTDLELMSEDLGIDGILADTNASVPDLPKSDSSTNLFH